MNSVNSEKTAETKRRRSATGLHRKHRTKIKPHKIRQDKNWDLPVQDRNEEERRLQVLEEIHVSPLQYQQDLLMDFQQTEWLENIGVHSREELMDMML